MKMRGWGLVSAVFSLARLSRAQYLQLPHQQNEPYTAKVRVKSASAGTAFKNADGTKNA